jgi:DAACS family dicarboxylate/amino acid:cation (Na+ or H+) symporter
LTTANPSPRPAKRWPLHTQILIGLLVGALLGLAANYQFSIPVGEGTTVQPLDADANGIDDRLDWFVTNVTDLVGKLFLRLMFMVVLPLVFSALSLAVWEIGDVRKLGRVGFKTLAVTGIFSLSAVAIGVILVNTLQPGSSLATEQRERLKQEYAKDAESKVEQAKKSKSVSQTLLDLLPENPLQEMTGALDGSSKGNGMLAVMFFALAWGIAMTVVPERAEPLVKVLEGMFAVAMIVIGFAMRVAPYGAGCLIFGVTARLGLDILIPLFWFVVTAMAGFAVHLCVVYPTFLTLIARMNPLVFFRQVSEAMLVAFGTSSSNASLPTALKVARENLGLPPQISNFVLTVGATGNQNGTALYEGVVVLFLAQVFGVELTFPQQVTVVLMSVLAGIGTAGVPGGSLPLIVVLLQSVGVPGEGIGIILGIDRILDMCRTVLNVTGDLAVAACVAKSEEGRGAGENGR